MGSVLVTGGAGFIGSHLVKRLVEKGFNVVVLDNFSSGKIENLSSILDRIEVVKGDIRNSNIVEELISRVDIVIHLAAVSRVMPCIREAEACFGVNCGGTELIARLCARHGKRLVFASSREVYGDAKYLPVDENHPLEPKNPYGASKVCGEAVIKAYSESYGLRYAILRLANVYGEGDRDGVIPTLLRNALEGRELVIFDPNKILDFVYVDDVVDAFLKSIEKEENFTVNIGSGQGTSLIELVKLIRNVTNTNSRIVIEGSRRGEVNKFVANIELARQILKWEPRTKLKDGVKKVLISIT